MARGGSRAARVAAGAVALAAGLGACGGSSSASANPQTLLTDAKAVIDHSSSVHFVLTSSGASGKGTVISGGSGDIARPDELQGTFTVEESGLSASLSVLAGDGRFYVKLPFTSSYSSTNPEAFGIGNPAQLLSPTNGLSSLLVAISHPRLEASTRIGSEVVDPVQGTVPGAAVPVLPDTNRSMGVSVVAAIVPGTNQLRRITLTGPFTSATPSTYTVVLTDYGEPVHVALPGG